MTEAMGSLCEAGRLERGDLKGSSREVSPAKTAHNMSSSSLRKKSELVLVSKLRWGLLRQLLANLQEVLLGTKLSVLFPSVPLAVASNYFNFGRPWIFALSLLGITPLAERISFLTEQIAYYTGPTVGGLLNATCGNATELIIAVFALHKGKIDVVKYSLLGSVLSNLLLVLGTCLVCGGLANMRKVQKYDRKQADVNTGCLLLALLCQILPLMLRLEEGEGLQTNKRVLALSRACSIVMLIAYFAYLFFQLKTHRKIFEAREGEEDDDGREEEGPVIGCPSAVSWLIAMTFVVALLSEYAVGTIESAAQTWGISVCFISIILLPIVGNAAEHAGAIVFAFKNKLDISLGIALGSATQIAMFAVPLSVILAWIMGEQMDLDFSLLETGSLSAAVLVTAFTLQDGTSHYLKGLVLFFCYIVISACFFVARAPLNQANAIKMGHGIATESIGK